MTVIKLNYAALSDELSELKHLAARGWSMRFSHDGKEIIASKEFLACAI